LVFLTTREEKLIFFSDKISFLFYKNRFDLINTGSFYEGLIDITGLLDLNIDELINLKDFLDQEASVLFSIFG